MLRLFASVFFVSVGSVLVTQVTAQTVRSYITADSVTVGDTFDLVVVAELDPGTSAEFRGLGNLGDLVPVGDALRASRVLVGGTTVDSVVIPVTTFAIDTLVSPPKPVFVRADNDSSVVFTDPIVHPVASLLTADTQDIIDITDLERFPRRFWPWLLAAALLIGGIVLYRYLGQRRKPIIIEVPPEPEPEPPSPLDEVRRKLMLLRDFELSTPERIKNFFVEMSDAVRTYVEDELGIPALESTTSELVLLTRRSPLLSERLVQSLEQQFQFADMVKFSDVRPLPPRCEESLEDAIEWVEDVASAVAARRASIEVEASETVVLSTVHSENGQAADS